MWEYSIIIKDREYEPNNENQEEISEHKPQVKNQRPLPNQDETPVRYKWEAFLSELETNEREFVKLFLNQYKIPKVRCMSFTREKGLMLAKFVDGINEKAVERIGDILLEESDREYILVK